MGWVYSKVGGGGEHGMNTEFRCWNFCLEEGDGRITLRRISGETVCGDKTNDRDYAK